MFSLNLNAIKNSTGKSHPQQQHILLLDDNAKLRSLLARYILLNCSQRQLACTIYQLGEFGETALTYFHNPATSSTSTTDSGASDEVTAGGPIYDTATSSNSQSSGSDSEFIIYEASLPRQALAWLNRVQAQDSKKVAIPFKRLTIISDVLMPADTEVGLGGLLSGLAGWQLPVNLVFMSSEPQTYRLLQTMLGVGEGKSGGGGLKPFFLIKGSDAFNCLPQALVEGAARFTYQILPRQVYPNLFISGSGITPVRAA